MSRDIAVIVPDVEVIWIFAQRTRHRDGLLAAVAAAEAGGAGIANLHTQIGLATATIEGKPALLFAQPD